MSWLSDNISIVLDNVQFSELRDFLTHPMYHAAIQVEIYLIIVILNILHFILVSDFILQTILQNKVRKK